MNPDPSVTRCWWCQGHQDYIRYHDEEWGVPSLAGVDDDIRLFEKISLEGFQAGLSWLTILRKRQRFREVFCGFDFRRVALLDQHDIDRLVVDATIIRHRGKIHSTIQNARRAIELVDEVGSLAEFFWSFRPDRADRQPLRRRDDVVAVTAQSTAMSRSLKKRGWTFVGPTTCYAFMQSVGIVNDHIVDCHRWEITQRLQDAYRPA